MKSWVFGVVLAVLVIFVIIVVLLSVPWSSRCKRICTSSTSHQSWSAASIASATSVKEFAKSALLPNVLTPGTHEYATKLHPRTDGSKAPIIECTSHKDHVIADRYIVTFKNELVTPSNANARANLMSKNGKFTKHHTYKHGLVGFSATMTPAQLEKVRQDKTVHQVERDIRMYLVHPTPPKVQASSQVIPWGITRVGACKNPKNGCNGVGDVDMDIFICDTGIDSTHPDLKVVESVSYATGYPGKGDDQNGHGTHVAGTAAATDNSVGVVGVCPGARLHAIKVLGPDGSGYLSDISAGIQHVIRWRLANPNLPAVINLSVGANIGTTTYNSLDNQIVNAINNRIVVCIAAGNDGKDCKTYCPAHVVEALTFAACDQNGRKTSWSNWGSKVDFFGPGDQVLSTYPGGKYATLSGTSMATPHGTGTAGLWLSSHKTATVAQCRAALASAASTTANPHVTDAPTGTTPVCLYTVGL